MATIDFDQKLLGRYAKANALSNIPLSRQLYQILGLSVMLSRDLVRARPLVSMDRKTMDERAIALVHHIVFQAREGLSITETQLLPRVEDQDIATELKILAAKLQASFYHIFCLFHSSPAVEDSRTTSRSASQTITLPARELPLSQRPSPMYARKTFTPPRPLNEVLLGEEGEQKERRKRPSAIAATQSSQPPPSSRDPPTLFNHSDYPDTYARPSAAGPPSVDKDRRQRPSGIVAARSSQPPPSDREPPSLFDSSSYPDTDARLYAPSLSFADLQELHETLPSALSDTSVVTNPYAQPDLTEQSGPETATRSAQRQSYLRDTIPSLLSDSSYITNPYAAMAPRTPPATLPPQLPPDSSPSRFLIPQLDYISETNNYFKRTSQLTRSSLPGSAPLRLSVACEYAKFLRDCMGDHEAGIEIARKAVRDSHKAGEEMSDEEFSDASSFVRSLKALMESRNDETGPGTEVSSNYQSYTTPKRTIPTIRHGHPNTPARQPFDLVSGRPASDSTMQFAGMVQSNPITPSRQPFDLVSGPPPSELKMQFAGLALDDPITPARRPFDLVSGPPISDPRMPLLPPLSLPPLPPLRSMPLQQLDATAFGGLVMDAGGMSARTTWTLPHTPTTPFTAPPMLQQLNASAFSGLVMETMDSQRTAWTLPRSPSTRIPAPEGSLGLRLESSSPDQFRTGSPFRRTISLGRRASDPAIS